MSESSRRAIATPTPSNLVEVVTQLREAILNLQGQGAMKDKALTYDELATLGVTLDPNGVAKALSYLEVEAMF